MQLRNTVHQEQETIGYGLTQFGKYLSTAFLHQRNDFKSLISTLAAEKGIIEALVEKDYWI